VERLAADLRAEFPDMRGFSADNVWRMRQLYEEYTAPQFLEQAVPELSTIGGLHRPHPVPETEFLRQVVAGIPWGHHVELLKKAKHPAARLYYLRATAQFGWSRKVLLNQIKAQAYERAKKEKKTHNFALALPEHFADQADEMMKSRYNLEFLGIGQAMKERDLENRLIEHLQQFILELGYGFCFIGRQYRLALGRKEYFVDLLFYHRFLKALVQGSSFQIDAGPLLRIPLITASAAKQDIIGKLLEIVQFACRNADAELHAAGHFFRDIVDACVMECYFEQYMAQRNLLSLDYLARTVGASEAEQRQFVEQLYRTLNAADSPIRNRLLRIYADSPDLLAVIKQEGRV